jgi:hypothetical protein
MPAPLSVSIGKKLGLDVIVKALAPGAKVIPSTIVVAEIETAVVFESANVAVCPDPLGTVMGVQFAAVFQSPETGLRSHVALPAWAELQRTKSNSDAAEIVILFCIGRFKRRLLLLVFSLRPKHRGAPAFASASQTEFPCNLRHPVGTARLMARLSSRPQENLRVGCGTPVTALQ